MEEISKGDKVKVYFGSPENKVRKFKRGIFTGWSKNGKHGFFWHIPSKANPGRILKRPIEDFIKELR